MGERLATTDISQKVGVVVPLSEGGTGSPSNIMWPGLRSTSWSIQLFGHCYCSTYRLALGHFFAYKKNKNSAVAEIGDLLATIETSAEKWGPLCPFPWWELDLHLTQHNEAWAEAYHCTKWYPDPYSHLATIDMGQKGAGCAPLSGGGAGSPFNTMSPGPSSAYLCTKWHPDLRCEWSRSGCKCV